MNTLGIHNNNDSLMSNLLLVDKTRPLDESEILTSEIRKDLEEAQCRERQHEKRMKKQAKRRAKRQQELHDSLASNAAIQKGLELLESHTDMTLEDECKSLMREVQRQEVKFCELNDSFSSESVVYPAARTAVPLQRLEDRMDKHQAKIDQQKTTHELYQAKMRMRDEEAANQQATDKEAKDAFAALKAKKAKRRALRKTQTYPSSKSSTKIGSMKRNLTT